MSHRPCLSTTQLIRLLGFTSEHHCCAASILTHPVCCKHTDPPSMLLLPASPQVVFYYISQSKANNHAVREAACAVIAELMEKVDKAAVSPHVPDLLRALLLCFKDSSWPVRDAACTACGRYGH